MRYNELHNIVTPLAL